MSYEYHLSRRAERYLARIVARQRQAIERYLQRICNSPHDPDLSAVIAGRGDGLRRARVGDIRILFYIEDEIEIVDVSDIGPRGDIYKGL